MFTLVKTFWGLGRKNTWVLWPAPPFC